MSGVKCKYCAKLYCEFITAPSANVSIKKFYCKLIIKSRESEQSTKVNEVDMEKRLKYFRTFMIFEINELFIYDCLQQCLIVDNVKKNQMKL